MASRAAQLIAKVARQRVVAREGFMAAIGSPRAHRVQPLGLVVDPESRNKPHLDNCRVGRGFSDIGPNGCRAAAMSHSDS
jgi:hypothetical protein